MLCDRDPEHRRIEKCHVPLARNGKNVDMIFSLAVIFDRKGNEIRI